MLKQSPSRNQRTKGFKVKHGFQIFLLIAIGIWLLYQLKHSHDKKKAYEESSMKILEKLQAGHETKKFGRKGFQPFIEKPYHLIDDAAGSKPEKIKERRRGDDEIIGRDGDRVEDEDSEEVEDLIDEEDKERGEENEEEGSEDNGKQIEDTSLLEDQGNNEGEKKVELSDKHYIENGASRVLMQETQSIGNKFDDGGLRKVKEEDVENSEIGILKQHKKTMDPNEVIASGTDSSPKVVDKVKIEQDSFPNVLLAREKGGVLHFADSNARSNSGMLQKVALIEQRRVYHNSAGVLFEAPVSLNGTTAKETEKASDGGIVIKDNVEKALHHSLQEKL